MLEEESIISAQAFAASPPAGQRRFRDVRRRQRSSAREFHRRTSTYTRPPGTSHVTQLDPRSSLPSV